MSKNQPIETEIKLSAALTEAAEMSEAHETLAEAVADGVAAIRRRASGAATHVYGQKIRYAALKAGVWHVFPGKQAIEHAYAVADRLSELSRGES